MSRRAFYAALRGRSMFPKFTQAQVDNIEGILDAGGHLPVSHLAYALATAFHETGGRMVPIVENMRYSAARMVKVWPTRFPTLASAKPYAGRPEALANFVYGGRLGNIEPGDGWRFRGRGHVQITGRANYAKIRDLTGVDVVANPDAALLPDVSAKALIAGIEHGIYTGLKAADFLPGNYIGARAIINADVRANGAKVARYAETFEAALEAGP